MHLDRAATPADSSSCLLRCSDVLAVTCDVSWCSGNPQELLRLACAHGASVHGFTPAWYTRERIASMRRAVTAA